MCVWYVSFIPLVDCAHVESTEKLNSYKKLQMCIFNRLRETYIQIRVCNRQIKETVGDGYYRARGLHMSIYLHLNASRFDYQNALMCSFDLQH